MAKYSDEEWEEIARAWREAAGQNHRTRLDAPSFVRWLKHAGYVTDYVCVPDGDLPGAEGKFDPDTGRIFYTHSTWNSAERGDPHGVWTLIHEASHAISGHQAVRYRATAPAQKRSLGKAGQDEFEAHRLTACILAPFEKADFKPGTTIDEIRDQFGLSYDAAKRRLDEFQGLYRRKHGIRRPLPAGVFDFLSRQKSRGYRVTSLDATDRLPRPQAEFDGDPCPSCGAFKLARIGLARTCENCGTRMGED